MSENKIDISTIMLNALAIGIILTNPVGVSRLSRLLYARIFSKSRKKDDDRLKEFKNFSQRLYYFKQRKLISIEEKEGIMEIKLTEKGKRRKLVNDLSNMKIPLLVHWDQKWRIIIFDIPEKYKNNREILRKKLKDLGFLQLQKSVWVYPFPCENEIDFISEYFSIGKYINFFTAIIDNDRELRKCFSL